MARLFWVEGFPDVRIAVAERPRGGDWLDGEMHAFRAAGLDILVSALQPLEERETWLEREGEAATAAGIEFLSFPIGNMLTPVMSEALPVLQELAADLKAGRSIAATVTPARAAGRPSWPRFSRSSATSPRRSGRASASPAASLSPTQTNSGDGSPSSRYTLAMANETTEETTDPNKTSLIIVSDFI